MTLRFSRTAFSRGGPAGRGLRRHLEGWPLGLGVVLAAVLTAALSVPRAVAPDLIPPPHIDRREQERTLEREKNRANAGRTALPREIRAVGEALRQLGRTAFAGEVGVEPYRNQLRRLASEAVTRYGTEKLLELRALQTELFVAALASSNGSPSTELRELGGNFYAAGLERQWFHGGPLAADASEAGTLYRVYWSEALGLGQEHPYGPSLNEWRVYYRFLLSQPLSTGAQRGSDVRRKLGYVAALAHHDPDYQVRFARGVLFYEAEAYAEAAAEFEAHLARNPDGPWSLRAKNHLAACGAALTGQ